MQKLEFLDIPQNTDEWLQLRSAKPTSSKLGVIMANYPKAFGEPAKKYAANIAVEVLTGKPIPSDYSNDHMARGHAEEPIANELYQAQTFQAVTNGGIFVGDRFACSPDGLVDESGVIEIKSVIPSVQFANIKRGKVDPAYKWQCVGNLYAPDREWLDFISHCANFPEGNQLFIHRIRKEDLQEEFKMIDGRLDKFWSLVEESINIINKNKGA